MTPPPPRSVTVLLVDDDVAARRPLATALREAGHAVLEADSGVAAGEILARVEPRIVIAELDMPDGDGPFVMKAAQALPTPARLIVTARSGDLSKAVEAMQNGAMTVLQQPVDAEHLVQHVGRAAALPEAAASNRWVAQRADHSARISEGARLMRGNSESLQRLYRLIERVAPTDSHVLVTGESGVGKELAAKEIHAASKCSGGPLVTVNCAAIPENLLESELFGHKKGAFTNATSDRAGRFRQAQGGTIFLDEIGEMKLDLQAKLLRVLQEREFQPVGGNETIKGDFRVIAATNQKLEDLVAAGQFRKDLYYRLSVFPLQLAPLRERPEDVPALTSHFIERLNQERATAIDAIDDVVMTRMSAYDWPGNIRELRNVVERMVILRGEGRIELEDLPDRIRERIASIPPPPLRPVNLEAPANGHRSTDDRQSALPADGIDLNAALRAYEVSMIEQALVHTEGNRNRAAKLLKINRTTLVEKIKRFGIAVGA